MSHGVLAYSMSALVQADSRCHFCGILFADTYDDGMSVLPAHTILTSEQMAAAEVRATEAGISAFTLMRRAGAAVADIVMEHFEQQPVVVLAGPGNNGGDGFIAAQKLLQAGWPVTVALQGDKSALKGAAAEAAGLYGGEVAALNATLLKDKPLVIDALFGTGLSRPIEGDAAQMLAIIKTQELICVAVDIPSGVNGDTGEVFGVAAPADITVTFHRKKRGHVLMPGARFCGQVVVADIGIPPKAVGDERLVLQENIPLLWHDSLPWPKPQGHKYNRGYVLVQGGTIAHTGAARMAARAALRIGAGLVTVACDRESLPIYAMSFEAIMTRVAEDAKALEELLGDDRISTYLIGPGAGVNEDTKARVKAALAKRKPMVLDADALTMFGENPKALFEPLKGIPAIFTPHGGEFNKLFGNLVDTSADKVAQVQQAAKLAGAVIIYKGADTVIAAPDGRVVVNALSSPWLATAGAGDVLAGMCAGLLAGRMPAFEAACAAVWMHGAAAIECGLGMIAEDLPDMLPEIWHYLDEDIDDDESGEE